MRNPLGCIHIGYPAWVHYQGDPDRLDIGDTFILFERANNTPLKQAADMLSEPICVCDGISSIENVLRKLQNVPSFN
jgi:hypothetical protein